jgi:LacI family transcriptional regulator
MNLQVVAEKAGVSVATVSRVINNRPGVARDKVERVRSVIKKMNFVPRTRSSSTMPSMAPDGLKYGNVAVIVFGKGHFSAAELFVKQLEPICKGLALNGISPVVCMGAESVDDMPPVLQRKMVDGILLFGQLNEDMQQFLEGIPTFWMTSHHEGARTMILSGNREIGELAAEYCHRKECKRVLAISSAMGSEVYESRQQAFIRHAQDLGMKGKVLVGGLSTGLDVSLQNLIHQHSEAIKGVDALFFPSDRLAALAHPVLRRGGIFSAKKAPTLISCGGEKNYLTGLDPRPVSVDMCADLIGKQAVEQILWRMRNPNEKRQVSVVIHPELSE